MQTGNDLSTASAVLSLCLGVAGCQVSDLSQTEAMPLSSHAVLAGSADTVDQTLLMSSAGAADLELPSTIYSLALSLDQLEIMLQSNASLLVPARWRYIGTRDGDQFILRDGSLDTRTRLYRVSQSEWSIEHQHPLTFDRRWWRAIHWSEGVRVSPRKYDAYVYRNPWGIAPPIVGEMPWAEDAGVSTGFEPHILWQPRPKDPEQDFEVDRGFDLDFDDAWVPLEGPVFELFEPDDGFQVLD